MNVDNLVLALQIVTALLCLRVLTVVLPRLAHANGSTRLIVGVMVIAFTLLSAIVIYFTVSWQPIRLILIGIQAITLNWMVAGKKE